MKTYAVSLLSIMGAFYCGTMMYASSIITRQRSMSTHLSDEEVVDCSTVPTTANAEERVLEQANREQIITTKSDKQPLPIVNTPNDKADLSCEFHMERIFQRHDCLRSHAKEGCSVAAPVHIYAWHPGQGFGRMLHHTLDTCMFAAALDRPCIIDFDVRDMYYSWRSFINAGEYNWDWQNIAGDNQELHDAYQRLPKKDANQWSHDAKNPLPDYNTVLPLVWNKTWTAQQHFDYWHGNNNETRNKILLSPNFGFMWWMHDFDPSRLQKRLQGCTINRFCTLLQNAMYAPTTLAHELFQERSAGLHGPTASAGGTKDESPNNKLNHNPPYGAIHLRSTKSNLDKTYYDNDQTVELLRNCLETNNHTKGIRTWWLVSDNLTAAEHIEQRIESVHTDYATTETPTQLRRQANQKINLHSGYQIKQKFAHEFMAPSIEDFMILHQSTVAIMTHGAFGESGARGNGKIRVGQCGKVFKIYRKPHPGSGAGLDW